MNGLLFHALNLSAAATGALVAAVWEGAVLAAGVWVALRVFSGLSASARSVIWLNVFILLALLHVVPFLASGPGAPAEAVGRHSFHLNPLWSLAFAAVWLAASAFRAWQLIAGAVHLRRLGKSAVPMEPALELVPLLQHNGETVRLCVSGQVARPSVLGFFQPRILLPDGVPERLTPAELQQVVIHEMEHLRRADDWTNLIQKFALVLFPLNPALAWVERRLCAERELACDDSVLRSLPGRKAYALCLTHLAEVSLLRRSFSLILGAWEHRPELVRRVQRILSEPARSMGRRTAIAATGSLVAGALGCALVLARAPQVVSFAPAVQPEQRAIVSPLDANELGRELGGSPRFVKAVVPQAGGESGHAQPVQPAVARHAVQNHVAAHKAKPAIRLASLRTPLPQNGALLVMADWSDIGLPPQVVIAFEPVWRPIEPQQIQQGAKHAARQPAPATIIRTAFAVVRTPDGWLVIQI
ncbi:MAG TPA: M56 family metallopeptidase [Terracidiphilus sp.]|nr:M56 family metallopeptidase [Terracidiphilus sp.]